MNGASSTTNTLTLLIDAPDGVFTANGEHIAGWWPTAKLFDDTGTFIRG
jgi:hypothetical protein